MLTHGSPSPAQAAQAASWAETVARLCASAPPSPGSKMLKFTWCPTWRLIKGIIKTALKQAEHIEKSYVRCKKTS